MKKVFAKLDNAKGIGVLPEVYKAENAEHFLATPNNK